MQLLLQGRSDYKVIVVEKLARLKMHSNRCKKKTFIIPIHTDSHDILLSDLSFLCFYRLCETHSVTIYGGENAIDPVVNSLCGFRDRESINYSGGNKLLVEFR